MLPKLTHPVKIRGTYGYAPRHGIAGATLCNMVGKGRGHQRRVYGVEVKSSSQWGLLRLGSRSMLIRIMRNHNENTELVMSSIDVDRIRTAMTSGLASGSMTLLKEEIARAQVVPQTAIPPDVVTMNSRVKVRDASTGQIKEMTLVYPKDANPDAGRVSVLAPIGSALLGLHIGQTIEWPLPGGRTKRLTVVELCYQPESAGDYHL